MDKDILVKKYNAKIDWNVAGLFSQDDVLLPLLDEIKKYNVNIPIDYVFGSIPCLFQGGHINSHDMDLNPSFKVLEHYMELGIGCRLTFSNHLLEKWDLRDKKSNRLLEYLNSHNSNRNGVIVSSDLLAKHIRKNYPNLQLIASVIKPAVEVGWGKESPDYYNHLFDLYDIIVVNIARTKEPAYLKCITYPNRVEFIANSHCYPNCQYSAKHYETVARLGMDHLNAAKQSDAARISKGLEELCKKQRSSNPFNCTRLNNEQINELIEMGFIHYKIEGRNFPFPALLRDLGEYVFETASFNHFLHAYYNRPI